jgi:hypothetical protein
MQAHLRADAFQQDTRHKGSLTVNGNTTLDVNLKDIVSFEMHPVSIATVLSSFPLQLRVPQGPHQSVPKTESQ